MPTMKLLHTQMITLKRQSIVSLNLSPGTHREITRQALVKFSQDVIQMLNGKSHLKHFRVVLLEVEKED